jgi:hypothetical protein
MFCQGSEVEKKKKEQAKKPYRLSTGRLTPLTNSLI